MPWLKLIITTDQQQAEQIADFLSEVCEAQAVSLIAHDEETIFQLKPEETPLWHKTEVQALYHIGTPIEAIVQKLSAALNLNSLTYHTEELPDEDWVRKTQADFPPISISHTLLISPSWHDASQFPGKVVKIDPGLAFGTGTHPTTLLCLEWLARQTFTDKTVVDFGCGSGILALAADALGAKHIYATDHDPQAIEATNNNLKLNTQQAESFTICLPEILPKLTADIVIANILATPLMQLVDKLTELTKEGGQIILSGILTNEEQTIVDVYSRYFTITETYNKDGWASIIGSKRILQ